MIAIFDFKQVTFYFNKFIEWVRIHPFQAVGVITLVYIFSVVFTIPQSATHVVLAFTYCQVFQSEIKGFFFTVPVILLGCTIGACCAFLLSRYLFKEQIQKQIQNSEWLSRNFRAIDELLLVQGITIVALLRLTFAPYAVCAYILGVTSIGLFEFIVGSLSYAMNEAMQVLIGCSLYSVQKGGDVN